VRPLTLFLDLGQFGFERGLLGAVASSTRKWTLAILFTAVLGGCASLPPGADFPKVASVALAHPEITRVGEQFAIAARERSGTSGFRIITVGVDGFLARVQMIDAAERTLDLQYFIFRGDETGRLVTDALLRAADRGVRVRVLIDDGDTVAGDEQILALAAYPGIEIRVFNPFAYRGHHQLLRAAEFLFHSSRLDYRMHNKLLVADNSVALIGGRNIGNQYFQLDPESQFADSDVFSAGPIVEELSTTFDEFWNSRFAIPAQALTSGKRIAAVRSDRERAQEHPGQPLLPLQTDGIDYVKRIATGEPYAGIISGRLPLVWASAQLVCDSPDKKNVESGALAGRLMSRTVIHTAGTVQSELLMVTPYFVPTEGETRMLEDLRHRNVRVRVVTNSLESATDVAAQAGYARYRVALLEEGVELYEIRSRLGTTRGSGQTAVVSRYGNYSLHAKLFVFDREKLFIGSMNFDQRSRHLNTEIGLIIDSPELAQQTVVRFDAMARPENSYIPGLTAASSGRTPRLVWRTQENGNAVEYSREPARSAWQRSELKFFSLLPLDREL
jgi:putative cardiolipin synthase